jgi:hypothetical protein
MNRGQASPTVEECRSPQSGAVFDECWLTEIKAKEAVCKSADEAIKGSLPFRCPDSTRKKNFKGL